MDVPPQYGTNDSGLNLLADASFLDTNNDGQSADYGSAMWPGSEPELHQISALERERDHLRSLLHHQNFASQPQLQAYDAPLNLASFEQQLAGSHTFRNQGHELPSLSIPQHISPTSSAPQSPYYSMPPTLTMPSPAFNTGFDLHSSNNAYFDGAANFQPQGSSTSQSIPIDEDKRQRNSAASARFRAKRKQREEQLQNEARQKRESLEELENRARSLEAENKFLRRLLVEKTTGGRDDDEGDEEGGEKQKKRGIGTAGKGKEVV